MSMKRVKEQLSALRGELDRQTGREWITVKVPADATDETIEAWLNENVGLDWRRHVIVRMDYKTQSTPVIVSRAPVAYTANVGVIRFSAKDTGLL